MSAAQTAHGGKYAQKRRLLPMPPIPLQGLRTFDTGEHHEIRCHHTEVHFRIGADILNRSARTRHQVSLPNGTGQKVRIAAFVTEKWRDGPGKRVPNTSAVQISSKKSEGGMLDFDIAGCHATTQKDIGKLFQRSSVQKDSCTKPKAGTVSDKPGQDHRGAQERPYRIPKWTSRVTFTLSSAKFPLVQPTHQEPEVLVQPS